MGTHYDWDIFIETEEVNSKAKNNIQGSVYQKKKHLSTEIMCHPLYFVD